MTEPARVRWWRRVQWLALLPLALLILVYAVVAARHAVRVLAFPFPLDYGEGPLLLQVRLLIEGTPPWRLYADPAAPPFAVVNYPPLYPLAAAALAPLAGDALRAGRLVSLLALLATMAALALLVDRTLRQFRPAAPQSPGPGVLRCSGPALLAAGTLLLLPITREWMVVMRVDLLGLALGLWGLWLALRAERGREVLLAAVLLVGCLYAKPSLLAGPAAAVVALLLVRPRQGLLLGGLMVLPGGGLFALLHVASGGWFGLHVVVANANVFDWELGRAFWRGQLALLWPLLAAALLGLASWLPLARARAARPLVAPTVYTLVGLAGALGVAKVGAYTNYFLELYAGLAWLAGIALAGGGWPAAALRAVTTLLAAGGIMLAGMRYTPLWSASYLRPAGLIEGENPPRLAFGRYALWDDDAREAQVFAGLEALQQALNAEVQAAGGPVLTDVPGVVVAGGALPRLQAFEHRQLLDQGQWDQRPLLAELAAGRIPLAVIDYLGNWLSPELITILARRYALDGTVGFYGMYRPVEPGALVALDVPAGNGLRVAGYRLASLPGTAPRQYAPGALLPVTLDLWASEPAAGTPQVTLDLTVLHGPALLRSVQPLLYGVLPPADWPRGQVLQHMQVLALPPELPEGRYGLRATLAWPGGAPAVFDLGTVEVAPSGRWFEVTGYAVPEVLLDEWRRLGDLDGPGLPLMPAVPFAWGSLQCFERACLELRDGVVRRRPLGERNQLADGPLPPAGSPVAPGDIAPPFVEAYAALGGPERLGLPVSGVLLRSGFIVQYTRYARLERAPEGGPVGLGRLGDDHLRLPLGVRYPWPSPAQ